MAKQIITSVADFSSLLDQSIGTSDWLEITQEIINNFADATFDHQWIHVDAERAKDESPFGSTISHGYLTVSLIPFFLDNILEVKNLKQIVNYGIEKVIYKNVVLVGSRLRMLASLKSIKDLGEACMAKINCTIEIEGQETPALEGTIIFIYYFN